MPVVAAGPTPSTDVAVPAPLDDPACAADVPQTTRPDDAFAAAVAPSAESMPVVAGEPAAAVSDGPSAAGAATGDAVGPGAAARQGTSPLKIKVAVRGPLASKAARLSLAEERRRERREARHRKRQKLEQSFKDYFDYAEPLKRLPHYRVLAVNRGERCKVLRVKIQFDLDALKQAAEQLVIQEGHPHAELLRSALHDALSRLIVPVSNGRSGELTERAEAHAVRSSHRTCANCCCSLRCGDIG